MRLLELDGVAKRYRHGPHRTNALVDASLDLDAAELVAVWGRRGSGRSTLLRLAAGIEVPDTGNVRFRGRDVASGHVGTLAAGLAYCRRPLQGMQAPRVIDDLITPQLARGLAGRPARARALGALKRAGVRDCAVVAPSDLSIAETARVTIARALCLQPELLLVDEPTTGVDLLERDEIFYLLRSLARDDGIAVLTCVDDSAGLFSVDRALTLNGGELHGELTPRFAPVLDLPVPQTA